MVQADSLNHTPEAIAAQWARLEALARTIADDETRAQYLSLWRSRFDAIYPASFATEGDRLVPDGKPPVDITSKERGRLQLMALAWFARDAGRVEAALARDAGPESVKALCALAWRAGTRVMAGILPLDAAEIEIDRIAKALPEEDWGKVRDAFAQGCGKMFDASDMLLNLRCCAYPKTDYGNAERFRDRHGHLFRYTTAKGWLGWDGKRWRVLDQEKDVTPAQVLAAVMATVRAIQDEAWAIAATGLESDENPLGLDMLIFPPKHGVLVSEKHAIYGRVSESSGKLGCIANLAKRWLTVNINDFDTDPMLLNCQNGTLRFVKGEGGAAARVHLSAHDPADLLTKITPVDYDSDAPCPIYEATFTWAQPEAAMRRYLQQWAGYNLTGDMGAQIFHIWYGPKAANGKSTIGNAWREAMGDYADVINVQTFLDDGARRRGDAATPDLVRLPGVRMLSAGEPPAGAKINEPLINTVTGGDPMNVRDNFRSFFMFSPIFKFTLWCNKRPHIPQGTAGIWRRIRVIPWDQHRAEGERDATLPAKLRTEYAGVLAWMVRGLLDWMDNGFAEPDAVREASADYREDSDPIAIFLRACTRHDPQGRVKSSELFAVYEAWANGAGVTPWKQTGFSNALIDKGFSNKRSNGMQWLGLSLVDGITFSSDDKGKLRAHLPDSVAGLPIDAGASAPPPRDDPPPYDDDGADFIP